MNWVLPYIPFPCRLLKRIIAFKPSIQTKKPPDWFTSLAAAVSRLLLWARQAMSPTRLNVWAAAAKGRRLDGEFNMKKNIAVQAIDVNQENLSCYCSGNLTPPELRQLVRQELVLSENGYILFDDTVLDKSHSLAIELVRRQWSGNAQQVIKGIGLVTCVYVNPDIDKSFRQAIK